MFGLSPMEMMICGGIALLLFGSRLPEVARSLGKGMREFKEGMSGVQNEFNSAYNSTSTNHTPSKSVTHRPTPDDDTADDAELVAPKFSPPPVPETADSTNDNSALT